MADQTDRDPVIAVYQRMTAAGEGARAERDLMRAAVEAIASGAADPAQVAQAALDSDLKRRQDNAQMLTDGTWPGPQSVSITEDLAVELLGVLRHAPVYALMGSDSADELGEDVRPEKFQGTESEHAAAAYGCYRQLLSEMGAQR